MISKFARWLAEASRKRGYQSSGVAILRPSIRVTTRSVAVNSTARGRKSPTSISKVLIPGRQQLFAMCSQVPDHITQLVGRESCIDRNSKVVKPEFGLPISGTNMDVRGLVAFVGVEERPVRTPA